MLALSQVLLFWFATMALLAAASPIAGSGRQAPLMIGALTVLPTFALTALFIRWDGKRLRDYCFDITRSSSLRFAAGLLLGFVLVAAQTALLLLGGAHWSAASRPPTVIIEILGYLLLATREELAFRGYPLRKLAADFDALWAQVLVAALFVIEHKLGGATWTNALVGSGLGALVFGMAALASRGLALPIGLHAAWNIGDWARGTKSGGGLWQIVYPTESPVHFERIAMASYVAVMSLAFIGLWLWYRFTRAPQA
jgi:hypothetical protein